MLNKYHQLNALQRYEMQAMRRNAVNPKVGSHVCNEDELGLTETTSTSIRQEIQFCLMAVEDFRILLHAPK
jgi:hypothetical protein